MAKLVSNLMGRRNIFCKSNLSFPALIIPMVSVSDLVAAIVLTGAVVGVVQWATGLWKSVSRRKTVKGKLDAIFKKIEHNQSVDFQLAADLISAISVLDPGLQPSLDRIVNALESAEDLS